MCCQHFFNYASDQLQNNGKTMMTAKSRMITRSYLRFISFHSVIERETCANSLKNQM